MQAKIYWAGPKPRKYHGVHGWAYSCSLCGCCRPARSCRERREWVGFISLARTSSYAELCEFKRSVGFCQVKSIDLAQNHPLWRMMLTILELHARNDDDDEVKSLGSCFFELCSQGSTLYYTLEVDVEGRLGVLVRNLWTMTFDI